MFREIWDLSKLVCSPKNIQTFKSANADVNVVDNGDDNVDDDDDDNGDLSQSSFFLLPLGVLQRFFPLHSFLTFHLSISGDDDDDNVYDVDDNDDCDDDNQDKAMNATKNRNLIIVELCKVVDDDRDGKSHNENTTDGAACPD